MTSSTSTPHMTGAVLVLDNGDHQWSFDYRRIDWDTLEVFHGAINLWHAGDISGAEKQYRQLISDYPEFIDVHHHLALLLEETGREEEAFEIWQKIVAFGLSCFPADFSVEQDVLLWGMIENRPFLRAYQALGLALLDRGRVEEALAIFSNILKMNPNDNQGVRALAIGCHLQLGHPAEVLKICDCFDNDLMEHVLFGRVLALYQLGQMADAELALRFAIRCLPLVAKELTKSRHRRPKDLNPGYVTHGGTDQAYYYWTEHGRYWKKTPGAIEFVRDWLQKHPLA